MARCSLPQLAAYPSPLEFLCSLLHILVPLNFYGAVMIIDHDHYYILLRITIITTFNSHLVVTFSHVQEVMMLCQ